MKLSDAKLWYWWGLGACTLPNFALSVTEALPWWGRIVNLIIPLAMWGLVLTMSRKLGRTILLLLPLLIINAWEIVLLGLYGRSVIAVDMFLNLLTTNAGEVGELLGNLWVTMLIVVVCYVPPLAGAIAMTVRKHQLADVLRRHLRRIWAIVGLAGIAIMAVGWTLTPGYNPIADLYPLNAFDNLRRAAIHSWKLSHYAESSARFTFNASTSPMASDSTLVVLVIGETSRSDRWSLNGYGRPTNPGLTERARRGEALVSFPRVLTESNTTHKSVPLLLSHLDARSYGDSIYSVKSLVTAFKEAGYTTSFLSNQRYNGSFIDRFAFEADTTLFVKEQLDVKREDTNLKELYSEAFMNPRSQRHLLVVHTYGSHFSYRDRYTAPYFKPDAYPSASASYRTELNNAYDNTIRSTDAVLDSLIGQLAVDGRPAVMIYVADHGEDIFDDARHLFLHASPFPSFYQVEVPLVVWVSSAYAKSHPDAWNALEANRRRRVSSSASLFHTLLQLGGVTTPQLRPELSLASPSYREPLEPLYLTDHNTAVKLEDAGFLEVDKELLNRY